MAKRRTTLSVADLERMLSQAKQEVASLQKERSALVTRIADTDARLAQLGGAKRRGQKAKRAVARPAKATAKRVGKKPGRRKMTLAEHVARILQGSKGPMSPKQITQALGKKGVSKSRYLNTQVTQILRSGKVSVRKVGRGQYVAG